MVLNQVKLILVVAALSFTKLVVASDPSSPKPDVPKLNLGNIENHPITMDRAELIGLLMRAESIDFSVPLRFGAVPSLSRGVVPPLRARAGAGDLPVIPQSDGAACGQRKVDSPASSEEDEGKA